MWGDDTGGGTGRWKWSRYRNGPGPGTCTGGPIWTSIDYSHYHFWDGLTYDNDTAGVIYPPESSPSCISAGSKKLFCKFSDKGDEIFDCFDAPDHNANDPEENAIDIPKRTGLANKWRSFGFNEGEPGEYFVLWDAVSSKWIRGKSAS